MIFTKLFRRRRPRVEKGAEFKRWRGHDWVERAVVLWVGQDRTGIPHVKFRLTGPGIAARSETRVLAREVFEKEYRPADAAF